MSSSAKTKALFYRRKLPWYLKTLGDGMKQAAIHSAPYGFFDPT
jgi:hypothetical protein